MTLKDLKKLVDRNYWVYLVLLVWFIVGLIFIDYNITIPIPGTAIVIDGVILYFPLLNICMGLFLAALFLRAELINPSKETLIKIIIMIAILLVVSLIMGAFILVLGSYILFIVSVFSFIAITLLYLMLSCYSYGVKIDKRLKLMSQKKISYLLRLVLFLGGLLGAILCIMFAIYMGGGTAGLSAYISSELVAIMVEMLPILLIVIYVGFGVLVLVISLFKKLNAWMGVFFLMTSIYAVTLLVDAFLTGGGLEGVNEVVSIVIVFCFDLFLVLFTVSGFMGEKAEEMEKSLGIIPDDVIIVWLIFSKASYEFASATLEGTALLGMEVGLIKTLGTFILFIPLMVLLALYGIRKYS